MQNIKVEFLNFFFPVKLSQSIVVNPPKIFYRLFLIITNVGPFLSH